MIYSRNYARMFVTLKQESSDYSMDFKESMGRCVIEVRFGKGKFATYIQGLKEGCYSVYFISCKNGNNLGVLIGKISTDISGKGEAKAEFNPENVCDTNLKIEDFHAVAIMPFGCEKIKVLLTGYVGGVVQWKEGFVFFGKEENNTEEEDCNDMIENEKNEVLEEEVLEETVEENKIESENETKTENENEQKSEEAVFEDREIQEQACVCSEKTETENATKEAKSDERKYAFESLNEAGQNFNDIVKKFKQGIEKLEVQKTEKNVSSEKVGKEEGSGNYGLDCIFANNLKMTPFQNQKKDVKWVRIASDELVVLPGRSWVYLNNPFVSLSEKRYKHLILGKFFEGGKEKYILGVPGRYFSDYRLEAGLQGFRQFKCCENKVPVDGDYGYWILNINEVTTA